MLTPVHAHRAGYNASARVGVQRILSGEHLKFLPMVDARAPCGFQVTSTRQLRSRAVIVPQAIVPLAHYFEFHRSVVLC